MKRFLCHNCRKTRDCADTSNSWFCTCGSVVTDFAWLDDPCSYTYLYSQQPRFLKHIDLPCIHRGQSIADINCGCNGKPKIYECKLHSKCVVRKLPKMPEAELDGCAICLDCDDRAIFPYGKVGFALQVFNAVGGMETWARSLIDHVYQGEVSGISTPQVEYGEANCVISNDAWSLDDLAVASEAIFVWGDIPRLEEVRRNHPDKRFIAVHHGSMLSDWAQDVFPRQLSICGEGVAVDPEVAAHFGVAYLPNPSIDHGIRRPMDRTSTITKILWNHRWSPEKRPELALEIAKLLPNNYEMYVSAPKHVQMPPNCHRIVQKPDNIELLADMDIFLSTSSQEAFGYSLAEAVHARVPIVCGPYGIGPNVATQLVDSDDPKTWADAIQAVTMDEVGHAAHWLSFHHGQIAIEAWQDFAKIV